MLSDVKETFFTGDGDDFQERLLSFVSRFGMSFEDVKDLSIAALIGKMMVETSDGPTRNELESLLRMVKSAGLDSRRVGTLTSQTPANPS